MKGNKWTHKSLFPLCLGLLISLFSTVFLTNSASAVQVSAPTVYWRAYTSNGNLTSEAWSNTNGLPKVILQYVTGQYRTLQGFTIDFIVEDTLNTRFKTLVTKAQLLQADAQGVIGSFDHKSFANPSSSHLNAGTSVGTKAGPGCTMQWIDKYTADYTCTVTLDDYSTITNAQVTLGYAPTTTVHPDPLAILCGTSISPSCAGNVVLSAFSYELTGTSSPTDNNVQIITAELGETNQHLSDINDTLEEQNERDQQDRDNIEQASDDADASADSSQQQAEATGSTLLQAFSDFVDALTSASASDCNINFNIMDRIRGGTVNLCSLSVPPAVQTIASLVLIGFCVPLSIATARKVIELFRSFQG